MNILYLYPRLYYERKMSRGRVWYGEALSRQPGVNLKWWGDGWDGYDNTRSLNWNIEQLPDPVDAVWLYKPEVHMDVHECPVLKFVAYNECWPHLPGRALNEVRDCGAQLVIHHHANDARCFPGYTGKIAHIPHGAPVDVFYDTRSERPTGSLVSGVQSKEIYPLRARMADLVQSGRIDGRIRRHPGYRLKSAAECDQQAREYAEDLKSSRVSLCCTSKYKYLLAKILESMLAGCVVVTDAPDDPAFERIRPFVVEVSGGMSDAELVERVDSADECLSLAGQDRALREFTTDRYAERLLACLNAMV